uniref:Cyclin-dependent kinase inhibitor domain-containing protein n=1 Tax=Lygus hesperus TaxID=30085 RepID=A0A0A9WIG0_LYGHE
MVQRCDEDDLGRRFSRVEQVKLERRRREKIEPLFVVHHDVVVVGTDPVKRVLFEPDQNLQGWIDGELGKIAESHRRQWNFDFKRGAPADIPGHKWEWESLTGPRRAAPKTQAPWAAARTPSHPSKVPRATVSPKTGSSSQRKITDFMTARKYPTVPGAASAKLKSSKLTLEQSSSGEEENNPTLTAQ